MMRRFPGSRRLGLSLWVCLLATAGAGRADEVWVAVASNFAPVLQELGSAFESAAGHEIRPVSGSTGKLYAQILHGAPFEIFLAADAARPLRLVEEGKTADKVRRTYARGRLVFWVPRCAASDASRPLAEVLSGTDWRAIAIANPDLAPYGRGAEEVISALDLSERFADKLVRGENIGQTFALVSTGNAEAGFVAASQLRALGPDGFDDTDAVGCSWRVPATLHAPIDQDAVLLRRGANSQAAHDFLEFLMSDETQQKISRLGYGAH